MGNHWHESTNGRHSLSHALWACQLPQGGSRERLAPFIGVLAKIQRYGRFSSPLRNSEVGTFHHSSCRPETGGGRAIFIAPTKTQKIYLSATIEVHSLSFAALSSSLREGAGKRSHSSGYSLKSGVAGDFHRPYETQRWGHSTIHRAARKPGAGGRFSSPLRSGRSQTSKIPLY